MLVTDLTSIQIMSNTAYLEATVPTVMVVHYGNCTKRRLIGKLMHCSILIIYTINCFKIQRGESISTACVDNNVDSLNVILQKSVFELRKRLLEPNFFNNML